jgi:alpha-methylacyl-CoA racemase
MSSTPGEGAAAPLHGVRVLDLTRLLPGGFATMVLADLGADVVKVEQPGAGDGSRWAPPYAATGEGALHLLLGRGKRSVTCDLSGDAGRAVFLDLVRDADVLVDSFRPGVLDRLGVGRAVLAEANPRLVQVALTGYGAEGERAAEAGHDVNYVATAGLLSLTGAAAGPVLPGTQVADLSGALWAVVAVLSALQQRSATGRGQVCDVSLTAAALTTTAIPAAAYAVDGRVPGRGTEWFNGGMAAYGVYRCADGGHVAVGALEPKFFAALCAALGEPDLEPLHLDAARQGELRERLSAIFATRSRDEWAAHFAGTDACVTPVLDLAEAMAASSAVGKVPLRDGSVMAQVGLPFTRAEGGAPSAAAWSPAAEFDGKAPGSRAGHPAPGLGEHTAELLAALGYDAARVAALREAGAV